MSHRPRFPKFKKFSYNRVRGRLLPAFIAAVMFGSAGSAYIYFSSAARDDGSGSNQSISPNPTIVSQSCLGGLNIALLADTSTSILRSGGFDQMKDALKEFISSLLPSTRTMFSLSQFNSVGTVERYFSNDVNDLDNAIDNLRTGNSTNWTSGLQAAYSTFAGSHPNAPGVLIIATDGDPTDPRPDALAPAITQANIIKEAGIHILAVGIGRDPTIENLQQITGPKVNSGGVNSDVITTDASTMGAALQDIARTTCSAGTGGNGTGNGGNGNGNGGTGNGNGIGGTGTGTNGNGKGSVGTGTGSTGTGTGTSTGAQPQPSPTPVPTATQSTQPSPAPTEDPTPNPTPAPAATQTTEPTPTPAPTPTAQGIKIKQPDPEASPFFDGKQYTAGTSPDNFTVTPLQHKSYLWLYISLGLAVAGAAGGYVVWLKKQQTTKKTPRKAKKR